MKDTIKRQVQAIVNSSIRRNFHAHARVLKDNPLYYVNVTITADEGLIDLSNLIPLFDTLYSVVFDSANGLVYAFITGLVSADKVGLSEGDHEINIDRRP